jgi:hypothetical protein
VDVDVDGVAAGLMENDKPLQLLFPALLLVVLMLVLVLLVLFFFMSPLDEDREGPRGRCDEDGGIEMGGASLCVRLDRP